MAVGVPQYKMYQIKKPPQKNKVSYKIYTRIKGQSIPKQIKGSDHHLREPHTNVALLAFSHHNEWNLTLSNCLHS